MDSARAYLSVRIARATPERVAIRDILDAVPVTYPSAETVVRAAVARRETLAAEAQP